MYFPEPDLNLRNVPCLDSSKKCLRFFYIPYSLIFLSTTASTLIIKQKSHRKVTSFRESLGKQVKSGPWRILYNTVATQSITERHKENTLSNIFPFSTIIASTHTKLKQVGPPIVMKGTATYSHQLLANMRLYNDLR